MKTALIYTLAAVLVAAAGCTNKKDRDVSRELVHPLSDSEVIAEYQGGKITAGDVADAMKPALEQAREKLLNDYERAAMDMVFERNKDKVKIVAQEISDFELESYMKANHVPSSEKEKIREFLVGEKARIGAIAQRQQMFELLKVQSKLGAARYDVAATSDMPQQGPKDAKITVQVFCDFANPMCNRTRVVMTTLRSQYPTQMRWIYRFFPVASNEGGTEAALVAMCANEQGKFWPVHDKLMDLGPTLPKADLVEVASSGGADADKLKACLQNASTKQKLDVEVKAAMSLGLTSTPAFFVNGARVNDLDQLEPTVKSLNAAK